MVLQCAVQFTPVRLLQQIERVAVMHEVKDNFEDALALDQLRDFKKQEQQREAQNAVENQAVAACLKSSLKEEKQRRFTELGAEPLKVPHYLYLCVLFVWLLGCLLSVVFALLSVLGSVVCCLLSALFLVLCTLFWILGFCFDVRLTPLVCSRSARTASSLRSHFQMAPSSNADFDYETVFRVRLIGLIWKLPKLMKMAITS